jgi:predicted protein tyrosine phosphatase
MSNNRIWNVGNPFQGDSKKVLCVCSAGLLRSPTTANVLHKELGYNTRACGTSVDHALIPIDKVLIAWADEIVVMEQSHADYIAKNFLKYPPIVVLNVADNYWYMDEELQQLILEAYVNNEH